jgi:hypothetical protein
VVKRIVAVRVSAAIAPDSFEAAMLEDVVDLVAEMHHVDGALVATEPAESAARAAAWPGMPVVVVAADDAAAGLDALLSVGADEAALLCADAPDLPALLLGKLFSALTSAEVAGCPAPSGELVAIASRLPVPAWCAETRIGLDSADAVASLRAAAPQRALQVGSGWHRVRTIADRSRLDPGLEGWETTRAWLARQ